MIPGRNTLGFDMGNQWPVVAFVSSSLFLEGEGEGEGVQPGGAFAYWENKWSPFYLFIVTSRCPPVKAAVN